MIPPPWPRSFGYRQSRIAQPVTPSAVYIVNCPFLLIRNVCYCSEEPAEALSQAPHQLTGGMRMSSSGTPMVSGKPHVQVDQRVGSTRQP